MTATFNPVPFDEGRFRLAYKGTVNATGEAIVVKKKKAEYTWESTGWDLSMKLQGKSQELAKKFTASWTGLSIEFTKTEVYRVISTGGVPASPRQPAMNEYVLVEKFLSGKFTKWCNNYGYISPDSELMPGFMHWSWVDTRGEIMIADLQGVQNGPYNYCLTDPVLLSNSIEGGVYGCTDMGVEGMGMFFLHHTCNQFCRGLPKPKPSDVVATPSALQQLNLIMTSTAYSHEKKFPWHIRQTMTAVFPGIAALRA